ncbi:hypothetical protein D1159_07930 [Pseudoflavonifractor sp. 524-17]|uniref:hypothetical protein n=1 Tax=Pseudoflavonifractor sp. 524-17 TaxID=2304577 RepID=UPI00137A3579|nr:hypothetical protein [Pseudoflavonifractor sp. 524-17]NCE64514.1 hypothetical protein [Pseudoflavonifractor sp. 524-17]
MTKKNIATELEGLKLTDGFDLLDDVMGCMDRTEEWGRIQQRDPMILSARRGVENCVAALSGSADEAAVERLWEEIGAYACSNCDAAVLYGFRTALRLLYALGRPVEMSQYLLER